MRRFFIGCAAAALLLAGGALASSTVVEATAPPSAPAAVHPVVGAWQLSVDEIPDDLPMLVAFHADGTYQESDSDGATGIGSWEATGPSSVNLTFMSFIPSGDDSAAMQTFRATIEVSVDGQTFTGQFTVEFTGEGFPAGEYGGHVTATRINVEPMGTPVGSLADLLSQFGEGSAPTGTESAGGAAVGTAATGTEPMGTQAGTEPVGTEPMATTPMVTEPAGTTPAVATTTA